MTNTSSLPRTTPEAEGIPSSAILNFIQAVEQHEHPLDAMHSLMLVRHGNVVAEGWWAPYGPDSPHKMYSLSKSFTSTAIGLAVNEGLLTVNDPVASFFPDDLPANPSPNLQAMTVRHLLSMNTGHNEDTTSHVFGGTDDNWPRAFLSLPVEREPGSWFVYNTGATYMLSAIITKLTGQTLIDYLRPRLFEPLGIANPTWDTDPRGLSQGGTGLHITTEDIARFGQLYLQNGVWNGDQLVPAAWIDEATAATSDNSNTQTNPDWTVGYGYQFWRCRPTGYRGDGAFGQFCVVLPEHDTVIAFTSGLRDMQAVLTNVWQHLLPALKPNALPADQAANDALREKLAALSLPLPTGSVSSPLSSQVSGRSYTLDQNQFGLESVSIDISGDQTTVNFKDGRSDHPVAIGNGSWLKSQTDLYDKNGQAIAAAGAWTADDTYEVRACFYETEHCPVLRFHVDGDNLTVEFEPNVGWGHVSVTTFTGKAAE